MPIRLLLMPFVRYRLCTALTGMSAFSMDESFGWARGTREADSMRVHTRRFTGAEATADRRAAKPMKSQAKDVRRASVD